MDQRPNSLQDYEKPNAAPLLKSEQCQEESLQQSQEGSFGQWQEKESLLYFIFVYHHLDKFSTKSSRKSLKIFKKMAKFVATRNSSQCRTHHQNNILKFQTLHASIQDYMLRNPEFLTLYERRKDRLAYCEDQDFCEDTSTVFKNPSFAEKISVISQLPSKKTSFSEPQQINSPKVSPSFPTFQEWQQCYDCFSRWIQKLSLLMRMSPQPIY